MDGEGVPTGELGSIRQDRCRCAVRASTIQMLTIRLEVECMPKPRTPLAKARLEAADKKNPQRFRRRSEPKGIAPLGPPPSWIKDSDANKALSAWRALVKRIPWLNSSHEPLLAIACNTYGRLIAGQDVGVQSLNLLRQCLGQMGATPADASKVALPDEGEEKDDILD